MPNITLDQPEVEVKDESQVEVKDQPTAEVETQEGSEPTLEQKQKAQIERTQKAAKEMSERIAKRNAGELPTVESEQVETPAEPEAPATPEVTTEAESQPVIVTEDMVKDNPSWKNLVGKPIGELVKASNSLLKQWQESQRKLAEIAKKDPAKETQAVRTGDEILKDKLDKAKLPDPVDDPKAFASEIMRLTLEAAKEYSDQATKPFQDSVAQQQKIKEIQEQEQQAGELLNQYLEGENVDMQAIAKEFQESRKSFLEENPSYYFGKPELLASDISRVYFMNKSKKASQPKPDTTVQTLKKKIEGAPTAPAKASILPQQKKVLTPAQKMEDNIVFRNTGEHLY